MAILGKYRVLMSALLGKSVTSVRDVTDRADAGPGSEAWPPGGFPLSSPPSTARPESQAWPCLIGTRVLAAPFSLSPNHQVGTICAFAQQDLSNYPKRGFEYRQQ